MIPQQIETMLKGTVTYIDNWEGFDSNLKSYLYSLFRHGVRLGIAIHQQFPKEAEAWESDPILNADALKADAMMEASKK